MDFHAPCQSFCGASSATLADRKMRRCGSWADAISSLAPAELATRHSMFDCPEASQTSPTRTSLITFFSAAASMTRSAPISLAFKPFNCTIQSPCPSALVAYSAPAKRTVTGTPAPVHPQTRAVSPCCKTIPSDKRWGSCNSPSEGSAARTRARHGSNRFIIRKELRFRKCRSFRLSPCTG